MIKAPGQVTGDLDRAAGGREQVLHHRNPAGAQAGGLTGTEQLLDRDRQNRLWAGQVVEPPPAAGGGGQDLGRQGVQARAAIPVEHPREDLGQSQGAHLRKAALALEPGREPVA